MSILLSVLQGYILGPLIFNFMRLLFVSLWCSCRNYVEDNTSNCTALKLSNNLIKPQNVVETLLQWFKGNRMKANIGKYHLLLNIQRKIPNKDW